MRAEILAVSVEKFDEHGLHGARIGRITNAAECNSRMIFATLAAKRNSIMRPSELRRRVWISAMGTRRKILPKEVSSPYTSILAT